MVLDSAIDKQRLLHIITNFPMTGPYIKIGPAVKELDALTLKVEQASIGDDGAKETSSQLSSHKPVLKVNKKVFMNK